MKLCKHTPHKVISDIKAPRYWDKKILINVNKVSEDIEHYIIQFSDKGAQKEYGWFYMSGKDIRQQGKQPNGRGEVYVVPLSKRKAFTPIKDCNCTNLEFSFKEN